MRKVCYLEMVDYHTERERDREIVNGSVALNGGFVEFSRVSVLFDILAPNELRFTWLTS